MVFFKGNLFQASILVVLLCMTPIDARQNVKVSSDMTNTLCSQTSFPSYCLELLKSIPATATADVKGLAKTTLDLALSNATKTLDQLHLLIPKMSDPQLKKSYESCSKHYDAAITYLRHAQLLFIHGQYYGMNMQASAAMTETGACDDVAADPSINEGKQDLDRIISIILTASNILHFSNYSTN